ncbi:MAG: hypothetical protein RLZZ623_861 [Actinomycetota bacterium]
MCIERRGFAVEGPRFAELVAQYGQRYAEVTSADPSEMPAFLDEQRWVAPAAAECGERVFEVQRELSKGSLGQLDAILYQKLFAE